MRPTLIFCAAALILAADERSRLLALGTDLFKVWQAPTTAPRDKKELLRTLLEEVIIALDKEQRRAHLTLRWRGSSICPKRVNCCREPATRLSAP